MIEFNGYKTNIAALSETLPAEEELLKGSEICYIFFWSGQSKEGHQEVWVNFVIKTTIIHNPECLQWHKLLICEYKITTVWKLSPLPPQV